MGLLKTVWWSRKMQVGVQRDNLYVPRFQILAKELLMQLQFHKSSLIIFSFLDINGTIERKKAHTHFVNPDLPSSEEFQDADRDGALGFPLVSTNIC